MSEQTLQLDLSSIKSKLQQILNECNTVLLNSGVITGALSLAELSNKIDDILASNLIINSVKNSDSIDIGNSRSLSNAFNKCKNLSGIPLFDTGNVQDMSGMCYGCINLISLPDFDTSNCNNFSYALCNCEKLVTAPQWDISNGKRFEYMFYRCLELTTTSLLDLSSAVDNGRLNKMFDDCRKLTNVGFVAESIKQDISFISSPLLSSESIASIFNGLATVSSTKTLTLNASNHYSTTQKQSATAKGWTIVGGIEDE